MIKTFRSIKHALHGISYLFATQRNARLHIFLAITAIGLGYWLNISAMEWVFIALCIGMVIGAEAFNTAIETICDTLHPEIDPKIKIVKDVSAGAVLIISIGALISGLIIFIPRILNLIN